MSSASLRILSLNLAHGRGTRLHQALVRGETVRENLDAVARLIVAVGADLVALQELDAPSFWSGRFDHLDYLRRRSGLPYAYHGLHVELRRPRLAYGTGIVSRYPLRNGFSRRFGQNALDTKGFVYATVDAPGFMFGVVSVHLDFKRERERRSQLDLVSGLLGEDLHEAGKSLVVAGDFNSPTVTRTGVVQEFLSRHGLSAEGDRAPTFPSRRPRRRIDDVLVSNCLQVDQKQVIPVQVSDHLPVLVEVRKGWP